MSSVFVKGRERMRVADLRPSDRNPRTISTSRFENLKRSLEQDRDFLDARPLLVNSYPGRENIVIAGNMRLRAAQVLGWDEVPVLVVAVPPEVEAQWNLKDNNQWGDYVEQDLAEILQGLDVSGADIGLLGFSSDDVERLLALVGIGADADDEGFDPTPPAEPTSRPGDVYVLGEHRLICGDSREAATWDRLFDVLGVDAVDAMWTDPPYGVDLQAGDPAAMQGDRPEQTAPLLHAVLPLADERLALGAAWYICAPTGPTFAAFEEAIARVGWHHAQTLIWVKNAFVPGRADYHHQHEAVLYGWKRGAAHRWLASPDQSTVLDDEANVSRMRREELVALVKQLRNARRTDVVREDKTRHNDLHPTMKPTGLIRHMLANSKVKSPRAPRPERTALAPGAGARAARRRARRTTRGALCRRRDDRHAPGRAPGAALARCRSRRRCCPRPRDAVGYEEWLRVRRAEERAVASTGHAHAHRSRRTPAAPHHTARRASPRGYHLNGSRPRVRK